MDGPGTRPPPRAERAEGAHDGGFGVYVHWPFCAAKCPYCDFNSHVRHTPVDEPRFAAALARELATVARWHGARPAQTVFFGGGTPSLMAPETVGRVLTAIDTTLGLDRDAEVTLEANPTSVERARFEGFRAAGVNRLSLGMQSLVDGDLQRLGRRHDAAAAVAALDLAKRVFASVSADFIYARPGQGVAAWRGELGRILELAPDHLSLYQLTIEPQTRFYDLAREGRLAVPDDDAAADLYELTHEMTERAGYRRYEVSNHARPGAEARHNLVYWRSGAYIGVGPGAHGRIVVDGRRSATHTVKGPEDWLAAVEAQGHGLAGCDELTAEEMAQEFLIMGLRLGEGIDRDRYSARTGLRLDEATLARLADDGLVALDGRRVAVTERARLLTNALVRELLP